MYLGAHFSISGSYANAVAEAVALECNTLQMFTKNQMQWNSKPITKEEAETFRRDRAEANIRFAFAHSSYLINLCSQDKALLEKSIASLAHEHERAETLGLDYLVIHPGSPGESGDGLATMKRALRECARPFHCRILLETSAGQGNCIGWKFEHLAELLSASDRLGVCLDTCHIFAAGYDISTEKGYDGVLREFDRVIGLKKLLAVHVNDSKSPLGGRVDRHEHIGKGKIGKTAFRCLMTDERLADVPKVLETPKENKMDAKNLAVLRRLAEGAPCPK